MDPCCMPFMWIGVHSFPNSMTGPLHLILWQRPTAVVVLLLVAINLQPAISAGNESRQEVIAEKGVVAADDMRCSRVGVDVLKDDGNAVDAAVATALCLGVVVPGSSGIGGGAFMVIRMANGTTDAIDMRALAPIKATEKEYDGNPELKFTGPLSIGVPGELAGLHEAWTLYGKLPWARLVQPAIDLAKGYILSRYTYYQMCVNASGILHDPGLCSVYTKDPSLCKNEHYKNDTSNLLQPGDTVINIQLANTLQIIQQDGADAYYHGEIGSDLVDDLKSILSLITLEDLKEYEVKHRKPVESDVFNGTQLKLISMLPPSSGGPCVILTLHVMELFGLPDGAADPLGRHRFVEATRHVFAKRENLGDPDFFPNVTEYVKEMISHKMAEQIRDKINDNHTTHDPSYYGARFDPIPDDGTSHMSIIDKERNAVGLTTSVNWHFGSQYMSPKTGILLNNVMNDFSIRDSDHSNPAPLNMIAPRKRPLSSMSPTIILEDGELKGVIGASGGPLIIIATSRVFLNHFGLEMNPLRSVLFPRVYDYQVPAFVTPILKDLVYYENFTTVGGDHIEVPDGIIRYLRKKGHNLTEASGESAICQFVVCIRGAVDVEESLIGVSDPRKGGYPVGY